MLLPWVLVAVAFVLGLVLGAGGMRFWNGRAATTLTPIEDPAPAPPDPVPAPAQADEAHAAPGPAVVHEEVIEGDVVEGPAGDLSAALRAQHEVLEKLEAKYRNSSAPPEEEPVKRRKRPAAGSRGRP